MASSSDLNTPGTSVVRRRSSRSPSPVIIPPRAQASRRCENTSDAKRQAAKLRQHFGPLTPFRALREPDRRRRDEERPFRSKQGTGNNKKPLDRKTPIQVCELLVPLSGRAPAAACPDLLTAESSGATRAALFATRAHRGTGLHSPAEYFTSNFWHSGLATT